MTVGIPHTQKRPVAKGVPRANGTNLCVVVHFPVDTFAEIRKRAIVEGTSFGEQVRIFAEWGLETVNNKEATP